MIKQSVFFGFDQGLDIILVKQLVVDHSLSLVSRYSGLQGVLMGPLWTWFLSIPFFISGGNPAANVAFLAFFSVGCSYLTYLVLAKSLGKAIALISLLFCLFAPFFMTNSQIVLSPHPLTYIFVFYIFFIYEIFFQNKSHLLPILGLLTGIFFQFEIAFAIFTIPPIIFFIIRSIKSGKIPPLKFLALGTVFFLITFLPQLVFDLRHEFLISKSLLTFTSGGSDSLYKISSPLQSRIFERIWTFRDDFLAMTIATDNKFLIIFTLFFALAGWVAVFKKKLQAEKRFLTIIIVVLVSFFIGFSLYPGAIWGWYRQGLPVVYVLLITIPFGVLWKENFPLKVILIFLGAILLWKSVSPIELVRNIRSPVVSGAGSIRGQMDILDYIYRDAEGKNFSYFAYTPPVYDYIWQYDFWWYGQRKYGYLPKNFQIGVPLLGTGKQVAAPSENEGLFYLIIEPDSERPWAPNGWKESFIKIGKKMSSKSFQSGVIVEKRHSKK